MLLLIIIDDNNKSAHQHCITKPWKLLGAVIAPIPFGTTASNLFQFQKKKGILFGLKDD